MGWSQLFWTTAPGNSKASKFVLTSSPVHAVIPTINIFSFFFLSCLVSSVNFLFFIKSRLLLLLAIFSCIVYIVLWSIGIIHLDSILHYSEESSINFPYKLNFDELMIISCFAAEFRWESSSWQEDHNCVCLRYGFFSLCRMRVV